MSLNTRKQERDFTAEVTALKPEVEALTKVRESVSSLDHLSARGADEPSNRRAS
jgi:hypothetical protein